MRIILSIAFLLISQLSNAQQINFIDIKKGIVNVEVIPTEKSVSGNVTYTFDVLQATDSLVIDAKNMEIQEVQLNKKPVTYYYDHNRIILNKSFKKGEMNSLEIGYLSYPDKALYFIPSKENTIEQVWTQGQGKYTSNWLPSFDDMNEKVEFDITITAPQKYKVVANGVLVKEKALANTTTWVFDMQRPMSSYLVAFAMGAYEALELTAKSGVKIKNYYEADGDAFVEPTYRYTKRIFDFLEDEIGVAYPWQVYKQVPVKDFLYAGMENTSLTIFSNSYVVDSIGYVDKKYINVNAHELAHQWFGDLVTEESSTHHWLQEGFATYYALLAERELFGEDHFYVELYKSARQLKALSENGGESLLDPKASSLTFYQRGAWTLFALRNKIGDRAFKKAVKKYLNDFAYKNTNTHDFFNIVMAKSQLSMDGFVEKWLVDKQFPFEEARNLLQNNKLTRQLLQLDTINTDELAEYGLAHDKVFTDTIMAPLVETIVSRATSFPDSLRTSIYKKALTSGILKNRQTVAMYVPDIPQVLQPDFEDLLNDKSYVTIENALLKLWTGFPEDREKYLDKTKGIVGFKDKNVEILWLALALITPEYEEATKMECYQKLISYTAPYQHFEVRQNAFQYIAELQAFNEPALKNLIQACQHPVWQFSKFSKQILDSLLAQPDYETMLRQIQPELNKKDQNFLNKRLDD